MAQPIPFGIQNVLGAPPCIPFGAPTPVYLNRNAPQPNVPAVPSTGLKRSVNFLADYGGCGFYRCIAPNLLLNLHEKAVIMETTTMILDPRYYATVESVKFQRQATTVQKDFVTLVQQCVKQADPKKRLIYEVDDVVFAEDIPLYNRNRDAFTSSEIQNNIKQILSMMDEVVVTTEYFRDYVKCKTGLTNVSYIPNYLMKWWFDRYYNLGNLVKEFEKNKKKPKIAIFASGTHIDALNKTNFQDDFASVVDHIIKTRKDFEWNFYGSYPFHIRPYIQSGEVKVHNWTQLPNFAETVGTCGAQVTFAALQDNEFNRCKSNIKLIESGAVGLPCVCPDMVTYKDAHLKYKNGDDFIDCIKHVTKNQTVYADYCKKARTLADKYWLDTPDNLMKHYEMYFTAFGSAERKLIV